MKFSIIKNMVKIAIIAVSIVMVANVSNAKSLATSNYEITECKAITKVASDPFKEWQDQANNFFNRTKDEEAKISTQDAIKALLPIGQILVGVATVVLVVVGLIFGVKYMMSGANDRAQLKQKLVYYIISIVLVYGAVGIFNLIINVMNAIVA